ncbi:hypothetical protein, conserved [Leishmania tarentolae]|uniref:Uncharacterized protein n=1 Tax=Leishmania tarentolae TaxID=5689 RepID=A0A640L151_LEITA|nr:hypothetical protein, conserved [Leishmania tarentolae]
MHAMEEACLFQPQINPRSRRIARHAPTLRERQEQEEQRRCSDREDHRGQPQQGVPAFAAGTESDVAESVWGLWRGVAMREARETEAAFVHRARSVNNDDQPSQRRPRVVYVTTVLGMLDALGITSPRHDALISKFLKAMRVEGGALEATKRDETIDAARFMYVFSTVWRAAVTNCTHRSPVPARLSVPRRSPPATQQRGSSHSEATVRHAYAGEVPVRGSPLLRMKEAPATEKGGSGVACGASSSPPSVISSSESGEGEAHSGTESTVPLTSCGGCDERRNDALENDADFLCTNMSDASPSITDSSEKPKAGVRSEELSPMSIEPPAGTHPSPEPRNPCEPVSITPLRPSVTPRTHHRSPFAAESQVGTVSVSGSHRMNSLRVIPSDSHLLSSTTSRELKKAAKRVPGGPMRECTFKPVINPVYDQSSASFSSTAIVQRRKPSSTARPTFQSSTQQFHRARGSLACRLEQNNNTSDNRAEAAATPLVAGVEAAVRRMLAARQQRQRSQSPRQSLQKAAHHSAPAPQSAVQAPVIHPRNPLLYVDVDLPQGKQDRLALYAGDNVEDVAQRFSILHGLSDSLCQRLTAALTAEIHALAAGKAP